MKKTPSKKPKDPSKAKQPAKSSKGKKKKGAGIPLPRRLALVMAAFLLTGLVVLLVAGDVYVHHSASWLAEHRSFLTMPLEYFGDRAAFLTDALGWTGRDAVNSPDDPIPEGQVFFAGEPRRVGAPAPTDITVLDRGEFKIGWSPSLRHPVWVAYHVPRDAREPGREASSKTPNFQKDRSVAASAVPDDYKNTDYDRGHMVPNHAILTRFGPDFQKKTYLMTNVAPQRRSLNRGPWREMEQRIADLWTAKYGEIWVIAGAISSATAKDRVKLGKTDIDVPDRFYMVIASQTEDSIRVLAVLMNQNADRWDFPVHNIVSVDELEELTGLDFFPDMQKSLQMSLESDVPTRLWPVRVRDLFKLILVRFTRIQ